MFGKHVNDLQNSVSISGRGIVGTLHYVEDYTGFSSKTEEQQGNYLALHAEVANVTGATIRVKVTNPVTLDADGDIVLRIRDKDSQTVTVVASADGYQTETVQFNLKNLVCEEENGQG